MGQFVIASRRSAPPTAAADAERWLADRQAGIHPLGVTILDALQPRFLALVEADDRDMAAVDVPAWLLVEPEIRHDIAARRVTIRLVGDGPPLSGALVVAHFRDLIDDIREEFAEANEAGVAEFPLDPVGYTLERVFVKPRHSYWTRVAISLDSQNTLAVTPLPGGPTAWWHDVVGAAAVDLSRGSGIRVAVLDTGCGPNECLRHVVDAGSVQRLVHSAADGRDTDGHGSHVCGLIGARPGRADHFVGVAPAVDLFSVRVCDATNSTNQADMAKALHICAKEFGVHLVNMSLAAASPSPILHEAILDLHDLGVLTVCAAGNSATAVEFPAGFDEAVAVGAVGFHGWAEPWSVSSGQRPDEGTRFGSGQLFFARFSCSGPEVTCAAPGVGIISTVASSAGEAVFAEMDGTSMASPIACAVLAARLSRDPAYADLPADASRADYARQHLERCCVDAGFPPELQGHGIPRID